MNIELEEILLKLEELDKVSVTSALECTAPENNDLEFFLSICAFFDRASDSDRKELFDFLNGKYGVLNMFLGLVWKSAENLKVTGDVFWLKKGLTAARIQGDRLDPRDFLVALSELYFASKDAGIDPDDFFENTKGAVPGNFKEYAVVKNRM